MTKYALKGINGMNIAFEVSRFAVIQPATQQLSKMKLNPQSSETHFSYLSIVICKDDDLKTFVKSLFNFRDSSC